MQGFQTAWLILLRIRQIMIEGEHNSSIEDLESDDSGNLAELRKRLELSNMQLLELTYNDEKFMNCIDDLNSNGVTCVQNQDYREALIYFNENEKILEYAASCGKTIDRSVILATLHNQACVNQKLWELEKSANYLEAIIYNINTHLESSQAKIGDLTALQGKQQKQIDVIAGFIKKKEAYSLYKLQFCAVNSQIRKHQVSIQSARSSIAIMKEVCKFCLLMEKGTRKSSSFTLKRTTDVKIEPILNELVNLQENLQTKSYENYLGVVRNLLKKKASHNQQAQESIFKHLRTFSIGKLMQLSPLLIKDFNFKETFSNLLSYENIITKALYLGISYFTVGTEMRFIASKENDENSEDYRTSNAFLLSSVYHLYAIVIVLTYVPVDTIFLNHLISSFNNHYFIDLQKQNEESNDYEQEEDNIEQNQAASDQDRGRKPGQIDIMQLNSNSSVFEEKQFDNKAKNISPIVQKMNEKGIKKITKLDGLLTQSVNKSQLSWKQQTSKVNKSNSEKQARTSENFKKLSAEDGRGSKGDLKKQFFRNKSPKNKSKAKDKKDHKESTGTLVGSKRSATGTANQFNSNQLSKGKNQDFSKKKRKKDVFSIYSPMTVDDQANIGKEKREAEKSSRQKSKGSRSAKAKQSHGSHNQEKRKTCIYIHRDKKDSQILIKQSKSKDEKKSKSKSVGKFSQSKRKKIVKGIELTNSLMKKSAGSKEKIGNHHQLLSPKSPYQEGDKDRLNNKSKSKPKLKNGKEPISLKMNRVEGKRKTEKVSKGK